MRKSILLIVVLMFLMGCGSEPRPTVSPQDNRSHAEKSEDTNEWIAEFETESIGPHELESVKSYVRVAYPEWTIQGMVDVYERGAFHCLSLDITHGADTKTINLVSRVFIREDKSVYWKTEPLNAELEGMARILFSIKEPSE